MNAKASEGLAGLLEWSGPVIFDRLRSAYHGHVSNEGVATRLARFHAAVWRALLAGDMARFEASRADLVSQLAQVGLTLDHLAEADGETMNELVEIVIARFRRSPGISHGYHLALLQLAGALRPVQAA